MKNSLIDALQDTRPRGTSGRSRDILKILVDSYNIESVEVIAVLRGTIAELYQEERSLIERFEMIARKHELDPVILERQIERINKIYEDLYGHAPAID